MENNKGKGKKINEKGRSNNWGKTILGEPFQMR